MDTKEKSEIKLLEEINWNVKFFGFVLWFTIVFVGICVVF